MSDLGVKGGVPQKSPPSGNSPAKGPSQADSAVSRDAPPPHPRFTLHNEDSLFDFNAQRTVKKPISTLESIINLAKGALGGGVMGIHVAYSKAGIWAALGTNIFFGAYMAYILWTIVRCAQIMYVRLHVTTLSYPDLAEVAVHMGPFPKLRKFSKLIRYTVDLMICIDLFGACCVYMLLISKTICQMVYTLKSGVGNVEDNVTDTRMYILILLIPVLALCMITSMKYLAPFALVGNIFLMVCVGGTAYYGWICPTRPDLSEVPAFTNLRGYAEFCGVVIFSMEPLGVILPVENNMKNPNRAHITVMGGMFFVVTFVIIIGFFGYWGFINEPPTPPVTLNFPDATFPTVIKGLMGASLYVTLGLNFYCPFNLMWYYISKKYDPAKYWFWERVYRAIMIIVIAALGIAFPNITNLMGLLGGFCISNIGFIFPAIVEMCVVWNKPGLGPCRWILWKNILILILGSFILVSSTYFNALGLIATAFS